MSRPTSIRSSYRRVGQISRQSRSSFYRSFWLLPRSKRQAMYALYSFARTTDDIGDCDQPVELRNAWLQWWRDAAELNLQVDVQLDDEVRFPTRQADDPSNVTREPFDLRRRASETIPALRDTVIRHQIPTRYLLEIVDGVMARSQRTRFETYEQLEHFSAIAAASVGLSCIHIWGFTDPLPTAVALDCGMAFQLTNILRDIGEDAKQGRIYLPRQHYEQHGLSEDDLLHPRGDDRLCCLVIDEAERAKRLFASGWQVWDAVHPDGRPMFSMIWRTYRKLLDRIIEDPRSVVQRRIQLSYSEKLRLRTQHFVGPLFRRLPVPPTEVGV